MHGLNYFNAKYYFAAHLHPFDIGMSTMAEGASVPQDTAEVTGTLDSAEQKVDDAPPSDDHQVESDTTENDPEAKSSADVADAATEEGNGGGIAENAAESLDPEGGEASDSASGNGGKAVEAEDDPDVADTCASKPMMVPRLRPQISTKVILRSSFSTS